MGIVQRHKVLAFYGVPTESNGTTTITYTRMSKFTSLTQNKNPIEYSRQYVDEPFTETDVVGYGPTIDYAFDKHTGNTVHEDIVAVTNGEKLGDEAVRTIVIIDISDTTVTGFKREYSVIPGTEGDNVNIYTYSGSFKARGEKVDVSSITTTDDYQTITFTAAD